MTTDMKHTVFLYVFKYTHCACAVYMDVEEEDKKAVDALMKVIMETIQWVSGCNTCKAYGPKKKKRKKNPKKTKKQKN